MTRTTSAIEQASSSEPERGPDGRESTIINPILQKLSKMDLPEQERVQRYMRHKWRLNHKPNSLRNSLKAIELLNAGMRLEYLQPLLGHHNIEMTRRYARLTDKTREEEYFRAMAVIEQGGIHGQG